MIDDAAWIAAALPRGVRSPDPETAAGLREWIDQALDEGKQFGPATSLRLPCASYFLEARVDVPTI